MKFGNPQRVNETTSFIADELRSLLDRLNIDSHMSRRIREACPSYKAGLTNFERALAMLRALALVQADVVADLGTMTIHADDDDDAEAA